MPMSSVSELKFISHTSMDFEAAKTREGAQVIGKDAAVVIGDLKAWIRETKRTEGSNGSSTMKETRGIMEHMQQFVVEWKGVSENNKTMILNASGMTGDMYRMKLLRLWEDKVGELSKQENSVAFLFFVGICTIVSSRSRILDNYAMLDKPGDMITKAWNFINTYTCTYVSEAGPESFPIVKVASCMPDIAFAVTCIMNKEELLDGVDSMDGSLKQTINKAELAMAYENRLKREEDPTEAGVEVQRMTEEEITATRGKMESLRGELQVTLGEENFEEKLMQIIALGQKYLTIGLSVEDYMAHGMYWHTWKDLPAVFKKQFLGNLALSTDVQEEHMKWEINFWERIVTRSNNITDEGVHRNYLKGFHSDFYANSVSDCFKLLHPDGTEVNIVIAGYNYYDLFKTMLEYVLL